MLYWIIAIVAYLLLGSIYIGAATGAEDEETKRERADADSAAWFVAVLIVFWLWPFCLCFDLGCWIVRRI